MKDLISIYPELEQFDGLPRALKSGLSKSFPDLQYWSGISFSKLKEFEEHFDRNGIYHSAINLVSNSGWWANVDIAVEQKLYILTLGSKEDDPHIFLEISSLEQVIDLLSSWCGIALNVTQLDSTDTYITYLNLEDDAQYICWQWACRHRQAVNCGLFTRQLAPLFYEAMHDPALSQITPYTSHSSLFLSRYTEFPFDSSELPIADPLLSLGVDHYYKSILQEQNSEKAETALSEVPSEIGKVIGKNHLGYEFTDPLGEIIFSGEPVSLLKFILDYTKESYVVMDRRGNGLVTKDAKQAVEFLRNALPSGWHRSIRGSAPDK